MYKIRRACSIIYLAYTTRTFIQFPSVRPSDSTIYSSGVPDEIGPFKQSTKSIGHLLRRNLLSRHKQHIPSPSTQKNLNNTRTTLASNDRKRRRNRKAVDQTASFASKLPKRQCKMFNARNGQKHSNKVRKRIKVVDRCIQIIVKSEISFWISTKERVGIVLVMYKALSCSESWSVER
ncbi:hypothetical protein VTL71DRAFT_15478 [Oculimacula yallundae]|uniref:Uncharacterized protein n=1 Tax=Oculimacula yallundae TaxID=86028 RepID=A0ABR4CGR4_9HELO